MHPNEQLLQRFYDAFARLDAETMGACYGPEPHFSDPAFPHLFGREVPGMWAMLLGRSTGIRIETSGISADDHKGRADWIAHYAFGPAQRPVVNRVHSTFEFAGGLIARQQDAFDFHVWRRRSAGRADCSAGPRSSRGRRRSRQRPASRSSLPSRPRSTTPAAVGPCA